MSADSFDSFPYEPAVPASDEAARRHYWAVAIGLQEVDGLLVSAYARDAAHAYERGDATLAQTGEAIRAYHSEDAAARNDTTDRTREADLVAQRIAELLEAGSFAFAPDLLAYIHRYLFQDLDAGMYRPGAYKAERLVKQEDILNGDSVLYADPAMIELSLSYLFREEEKADRSWPLAGRRLEDFCTFIAHLWQVHPFVEGNARITAVFSELYLAHLGIADASNEPYEHHARYFRDALVKANYRNARAGVSPDKAPLMAFYDNLLNGARHALDREQLIVTPLFEHPDLLANIAPERALSRAQRATSE